MPQQSGDARFAGSGGLSTGPIDLSVIQPDADSVDGSWTDQAGGTSLFAAIDEMVTDDVDYIVSSRLPSTDDA